MQSTKFKNKYRTSSARAAWHDYTGGIYFVTICTKNREHYFGEITYDQNHEAIMNLTDIGKNTDEQIRDISTHYPYAEIPLWVVMPNHLHCLVIIRNDVTFDCRDAINRVSTDTINRVSTDTPTDTVNRVSTDTTVKKGGITGNDNPMIKQCLGTVIRGLKARATHFARKNGIYFDWQPRFHDHIVRNQDELNRIAEYIENNPARWLTDQLNDEVFKDMPEMMK